jgi:hypothetical protein
LSSATGAQGAQHAGGAAHVELHLVHLGAGLSEMPPVSKVMPLPTSTMGGAVFGGAPIFENDQFGRLCAAGCDRQQGAHSQGFHLLGIEHLE